MAAVEQRLHTAGIATLAEVIEIATAAAQDIGLPDARVTSDAKHVEIGLTDKSDSARWAFDHLWQRGIGAGLVLIVGDEFGPLGGVSGSDSMMLVPRAASATVASVGVEPGGLPATVNAVAGGPAGFRRICGTSCSVVRAKPSRRSTGVQAGRSPSSGSTLKRSVPRSRS